MTVDIFTFSEVRISPISRILYFSPGFINSYLFQQSRGLSDYPDLNLREKQDFFIKPEFNQRYKRILGITINILTFSSSTPKKVDFFGVDGIIGMMKRIYTPYFQEYADKKIILITGPRQSGKTTITRMFAGKLLHLNYDNEEDRQIYLEKSWDRKKDFIIFDELHKMKNWKRWLKGIFDKEGNKPRLVVTGSASLDIYKKMGDSLAGRYFQYRVHPLDIRELLFLNKKSPSQIIMEKLLKYSGFPEPFIEGNQKFYNLWKKTHLDIILKQDIIYQENLKDIKSIEILIDLLKKRVASPVSYFSLAEDLECTDKTVKRWLNVLESMYVIFKILPFHKNVARTHLKRPKYYFYDIARVSNKGVRLENLVACSLLKECHFRQDCLGENWNLHYIGKKGGLEIDFLITKDETPNMIIETKQSDDSLSKNFKLIAKDFPGIKKIQLVKNLKREKTFPDGTKIRSLKWLADW